MHFIISELLIRIRHFRGATRTDENVTVEQLHLLRDAPGKSSGELPQFLPAASHAVDRSRCAVADVSTRSHLLVDVVIRFDIQHDSFRVSTSSAIATRMLPVFRFSYPSSTLAHHWPQNCASSVKHVHHCLLLHYAVSGFNRPIIDSFQNFPDLQSTNHRLPSRFA